MTILLYFLVGLLLVEVGLRCYITYEKNKLEHLNNIKTFEERVTNLTKDLLDEINKDIKHINPNTYLRATSRAASLTGLVLQIRKYYISVGRCPFYIVGSNSSKRIERKFKKYLPTLNASQKILDNLRK